MADGTPVSPDSLGAPEQRETQSKAYFETRSLEKVDRVPLLKKAGEASDVGVNVLRNAGEPYYMLWFDRARGKNVDAGGPHTVPDGYAFVLVSGMVDKEKVLRDYWEEVKRLEQEETPSKQTQE